MLPLRTDVLETIEKFETVRVCNFDTGGHYLSVIFSSKN